MADDAPEPIRGRLSDVRLRTVKLVAPRSDDSRLFKGLLAQYHYLGHRNTVGDLPAGRQGTCAI